MEYVIKIFFYQKGSKNLFKNCLGILKHFYHEYLGQIQSLSFTELRGVYCSGIPTPPGGGFLKETYDWGGKIKGREVTRRKIGKGNQTWSQGGGKESKARELYTPLTKLSGNLPGSILRWFK